MRFLLALCLVAAFPNAAKAWGPHGHALACQIAYDRVNAETKAEIDRLLRVPGDLRQRRFSSACNFADAWRSRHDDDPVIGRNDEHFLNLRRTDRSYDGSGCGTKPRCVVRAIEDDFAILADRTKTDRDRQRALIFLGHWVGDIHQPLHVGHSGGGNSISVTGACQQYGIRNLHSVFDTCILRYALYGDASNRVPGVREAAFFASARSLSDGVSADDASAWTQSNAAGWASESFAIATDPSSHYCFVTNGSCRDSSAFNISEEYLQEHGPMIRGQIMRAGVRLAALLEQALRP
jgi:hypothetical protein